MDAQEFLKLFIHSHFCLVTLSGNKILFFAQVFALLLQLVRFLVPEFIQTLV